MIETSIIPNKGVILAIENAQDVGLLEFELDGYVMTITHTHAFVKGKGVGKMLVLAAIDYAKENHLKIRPVCSYAYAVMEQNSEYSKLLTYDAGDGISCEI